MSAPAKVLGWLATLWKKTPKSQRWMLVAGAIGVTFLVAIVIDRSIETVTSRNYRVKVTTDKGSFKLAPVSTAPRMTE